MQTAFEKEVPAGSGMKRKQIYGQAGMVWGCNSSPLKQHDMSGFGDFGKYMAEKKRKLSLQYQAEACNKDVSTLAPSEYGSSSCSAEPSTSTNVDNVAVPCNDLTKLFAGMSIFVDGFTTPSHQELRNLMLEHGGMFQNYFSRDLVTHIICTTLPDSKIRDHRSFSRGLPIVKPSWIVDSIFCGRVLPTSSYAHERIAQSHPNQLTLSRFLDCTKNVRAPLYQAGILPVSEPLMCLHQEFFYPKQQCIVNTDAGAVIDMGHLKSTHGSSSKQNLECDLQLKKDWKVDSKILVSPHALEKKKPRSFSQNVRSHCALGDANFVQNYFKNSRLHFIGTWRTRYQNCFNGSRVEKDQQLEKLNMRCDNGERIIMHVDMDCFFVSVVVRNRSELVGKPVAVCHSEKTHGTAEISSSNYAARAFGVRSGMFIRDAKALCRELEVVPYDFEGYQQVADQFYDVLHKHCKTVQAVSCDEAYLDVTGMEDPEALASRIRKEVFDLTRCTASVGIAQNLLLARMATRKAKPDGQFRIVLDHVEGFLSGLSVEELPGVGWSLQERLHSKQIYTCKQLRAVSKETLQHDFGVKIGDMLWCFARGIDKRQVMNYQERKSIGAEVNWGVRFDSASDAQHFLTTLCEEVSVRLQNAVVTGRTFTLKIKKRKEGAGEPQKFMGCGSCDSLSKSITLGCATNSVDVILRVSRQVFTSFHLDVRKIRGLGLQVTRLESSTTCSIDEGQQHQLALEACLQSFPKGSLSKNLAEIESLTKGSKERVFSAAVDPWHVSAEDALPWGLGRSHLNEKKGMQILGKVRKGPFSGHKQISCGKEEGKKTLSFAPHHSELDQSVLASLPPDIVAELDDAYNGAVIQRLSRVQKLQSAKIVSAGSRQSVQSAQTVSRGTGADLEPTVPLSFSQVDMATLEELPVELRKDILSSLRPHRRSEPSCIAEARLSERPQLLPLEKSSNPSSGCLGVPQLDGLWSGDPPKWVLQFERMHGPGTDALHLLSKTFLECGCPAEFSGVLTHAMCHRKLNVQLQNAEEDWKKSVTFQYCLELFKQYVVSKVSCNLEEVFTTVRVLNRLARKCHFWETICRNIMPFIQEATREFYGGSLV